MTDDDRDDDSRADNDNDDYRSRKSKSREQEWDPVEFDMIFNDDSDEESWCNDIGGLSVTIGGSNADSSDSNMVSSGEEKANGNVIGLNEDENSGPHKDGSDDHDDDGNHGNGKIVMTMIIRLTIAMTMPDNVMKGRVIMKAKLIMKGLVIMIMMKIAMTTAENATTKMKIATSTKIRLFFQNRPLNGKTIPTSGSWSTASRP